MELDLFGLDWLALIGYNTTMFSLSLIQYGTTPLIWASRKGHYDCVMHLLENGADVDQEGAVCIIKYQPYIHLIKSLFTC